MAYDIGPKIGIDGEAEFRKAIQNINTNIRTLGTEMLAVTSAYDANDKSVANLTRQNEVLVKQIDAQKEKLAELQKGLAASAEKYGENDENTQRWQQTVNKAIADLNKMDRQLASNNTEIENQARALDNVIEGEDALRASISSINTNIKTLGTEMLAVTSAYDANDKSIAALTSQNEVLTKQIDAQKEKLSELQKGLEASAAKFGENDEKTQAWQQDVNKATAELNQMKRQLTSNNTQMEAQVKAFDSVIEGEDALRASISSINTNIKTLGTEMLAVTSAYDANDKSVAALTSQNEVLSKQIDAQKEKLNLLREGLEKSSDKFGENDERTQAWQQDVNKATAELNQMERQLAKNSQSLEDLVNPENEAAESTQKLGDSMEETESTAKRLHDTLSSVVSGLGKLAAAAGAAVAAAGAAIAGFTKTAVESYAQSEQLVGGVETLFKESSGKVLEYANNAYKTAGMSANEYMESVTGFSASLLQGLGGDTAKAADIANLALIDMADNANKLGSDMSSIQTAYQGFAKQNYSMLDNLKLGYGGTKDEMVRLINDSGILTEQISNLDNISFDQIIEAIHAVQTNMGITGATAQEASTTIEGSLNAVKSAYGNLLSGIGSGGQDLDLLINNLTDSVMTAANNIVPVVETVLANMGAAITALTPIITEELPQMVENILPSLLEAGVSLLGGLAEGITSALPVLTEAAMSAVGMLTSGIMDTLPQLAEAAVEIIVTLATGISDSLPELIPSAVDTVLQIVETLTDPDSLGNIVSAALEIITALAEGLINALPTLAARTPMIIANIVTTLTANLPKIITMAGTIIATLAKGLIQSIPNLVKSVPQMVTAIVGGFTSFGSQFLDIGKNIVNGVWDGIKGMGTWLKEKVSGFFSGIVDGVKNVLGIHSPSTVFAGIGGYMAEGLSLGFDNEMAAVQRRIDRSMEELAWNASAGVQVIGNVTGAAVGGNNYAPEDLSEMIAAAVSRALNGTSVNLNQRKVGEMMTRWQENNARSRGD